MLPADSGFGRAGAKLDPKTGALMHDKWEDKLLEERRKKEKKVEPPPVEPGIRFSKDSLAMINLQEKEETMVSPENEILNHSAKGIISVVNLSESDRIWDISVRFKDTKGLSFMDYESIEATEIEPKNRKSKEYRIDLEEPSILLEENVTTSSDYMRSTILIKDKPAKVRFQLKLLNTAEIPYNDLVLKKSIPPKLKNINFTGKGPEGAAIEGNLLIWKMPSLNSRDLKTFEYEGEIDAADASDMPVGDIALDARGIDTLTTIIVSSFDAMCRNMYFIDVDETDEPGEWICRFVVENSSSFEVEILKVEVRDSSTGQLYLDVDRPKIRVPPKKQWISNSWNVKSETKPSFIKQLILNVIPGLEKEILYRLNKKGGNFQVAGLSFNKSYDKNLVQAKKETDIVTTIDIENVGSAELDQIFIRDLIPRYMIPPSENAVRIIRDGVPLKENFRLTVEPYSMSPATEQKLFLHIHDLSDFGGSLKKGEKITVQYLTPVIRPEPNIKIEAPAEVDAKPELPGPVVSGTDIAGAPTIGVQQILRKFSIGKSIVQGTDAGEYHIGLLYKNRGDRPIENLLIMDNIPKNFSGMGFTLEPEKTTTPEGLTLLQWKIPSVKEGESIGITYLIRGQGRYHPKDAQVFYNSPTD